MKWVWILTVPSFKLQFHEQLLVNPLEWVQTCFLWILVYIFMVPDLISFCSIIMIQAILIDSSGLLIVVFVPHWQWLIYLVAEPLTFSLIWSHWWILFQSVIIPSCSWPSHTGSNRKKGKFETPILTITTNATGLNIWTCLEIGLHFDTLPTGLLVMEAGLLGVGGGAADCLLALFH